MPANCEHNFSNKRFSDFFGEFRKLKKKHDEVAAETGARFNIFSVLDVESNEVKTHSAFLAEFLNPKGSHSCGAVFLRLFFDMLRKKFPKKLPGMTDGELEFFEVSAEADTGGLGRIDILIENDKKCIVIENKIYAADQKRQLGRYYEYAKKKTKKKFGNNKNSNNNFAVVYLTLDGHEPGDYTLFGDEQPRNEQPDCEKISKEKVLCLSYSKNVVEWVAECVKVRGLARHIHETLFQYQSLLKKLTNQTIDQKFIMKSNDILWKNYDIVPELEQAISAFKKDALFRFWSELKDAISSLKVQNVQYVAGGGEANLAFYTDVQEFKDALGKQYSVYKRHGLAFSLGRKDDSSEIFFSIVTDIGLFYGFSIVDDKNSEFLSKYEEDLSEHKERVKKACERADFAWEQSANPKKDIGFPLGYAYSKVKGVCREDKLFSDKLGEKFFACMSDSGKRKAIIEGLTGDVKLFLNVWQGKG